VKALDSFAFLMLKAVILEQIQKTICFFEQMKKVELKNAKLTAFGSTRRKGISIEKDKVLKAILKSGVK
jgi:2-isopropylmalate synthase